MNSWYNLIEADNILIKFILLNKEQTLNSIIDYYYSNIFKN